MPPIFNPAVNPIINSGNINSILSMQTNTTPVSGSLVFPSDLAKDKFTYWMSFSFYQYQRPSFTDQSVILKDLGTIRLPLPNKMVDEQDVCYDEVEAGLAVGMALNAITEGNLGTAAGEAAIGVGTQNIINKLNQVSGTNLGGLALQSFGLAQNPFLTVLFKAPKFKHHDFSWKLTPSNQGESVSLNSILNTFAMNQLPNIGSGWGGALLTYPNIVQITISNNDPNFFTYVFKPTVIESFTKDHTPERQPSFFGTTRAPTAVEFRLKFLEIEFWLQQDYTGIAGALPTAASIAGNIKTTLGL